MATEYLYDNNVEISTLLQGNKCALMIDFER